MRTLSIILLAMIFSGCKDKPTITSATIINESSKYGLPIKICLSKEFSEIYNARISIETKSGFKIERSDVKISNYNYGLDKTLCTHLNIYIYLLPKRAPDKMSDDIRKNIFPGNIKSLDIHISDNHGLFYEEAREFTSFKAINL